MTDKTYGPDYYFKAGSAGGLCCCATHAGMVPFDVVKTKIQLNPVHYNKGLSGTFKQVVQEEGTKGLLTGLGPTAVGYFIQGFFKFGGNEYFKVNFAKALGAEKAWDERTAVNLVAGACAETIADFFLCPLEATRIRLVSDPKYAPGLLSAFPKIMKNDGISKGFYSGFGPILFKQVPYTMAMFAVQGRASEAIYGSLNLHPNKADTMTKTAVALASGTIAGVAAAIISHPADTLLSMINKSDTAGGTGGTMSRLANLSKEAGVVKLCVTGLGPRCVMIAFLTALQFVMFEDFMKLVGSSQFQFEEPKKR